MATRHTHRTILILAAAIMLTGVGVFTFDLTADPQERYLKPLIIVPLLNKTNHRRVKLGKMLFFDPRLSGSNWISCGTCHNPAMGWSDGLNTAIGEGQNTLRRATPTILNTAYNRIFMWDGRFRTLEQQVLGPIEAANEMNQNIDELIDELNDIKGYVELFKDAYPGRGINRKTISMAIASFERTIVSADAPFDRWLKGDGEAISYAAKQGFELFEGKARCSVCHSGYNFQDDGFHNIGLRATTDKGRFAIKPVDVSMGAFKTPTLRDVELTSPYMHNGVYNTLEQVVDHYSRGGDNKENLSPNIEAVNLTRKEISHVVEFLKTLTGDRQNFVMPKVPHRS